MSLCTKALILSYPYYLESFLKIKNDLSMMSNDLLRLISYIVSYKKSIVAAHINEIINDNFNYYILLSMIMAIILLLMIMAKNKEMTKKIIRDKSIKNAFFTHNIQLFVKYSIIINV